MAKHLNGGISRLNQMTNNVLRYRSTSIINESIISVALKRLGGALWRLLSRG